MDYRQWQAQIANIPGAPEHISYQAYGTRTRYLSRDGFLDWEVFWLAQHFIGSPGMKAMRVERRKLLGEARSDEWTPEEYEDRIRQIYRDHNWTFRNGELSPFEMLEFYKRQMGIPDSPPKRGTRRKTGTQKSKREASSGGR